MARSSKRHNGDRKRRCKPAVVSLVSMPFKDLRHPPIQLGILQQALLREGISCTTHSLELVFMEHIRVGTRHDVEPLQIDDYQDVAHKDYVVQLGDWIFKVPPYAATSPADDEYLAYVKGEGTTEKAIANALRMKELVPGFLHAAAREILDAGPRIVGFSTVFQQNVASLVLAKILKEIDPSLIIVFGGDNCDGVMGAALHQSFPWIDLVVRGEGERVLVEIAKDVIAGSAVRPHPGMCYRADGQSIAVPPESRPTLPITEVPAPRYDEYFERLERSSIRNELMPDIAILFESSRGCWWGAKSHCTFCGLNAATMMFRSKSADRVVDEIVNLSARHKILKFVAVDDIIDVAHIRDLLPLLRDTGCDFDIYYETKSNLTKEQLRLFYAAGVRQIQPGIESLSTPILRLMRKGVSALQNIRLLKWCAELGIVPDWNLLCGFPGEPPEEYERMAEVIPALVHLEAPNFTPVQIQRFSPYFERPNEFGLELMGPMPYYKYLYDVSPQALADIAYDYEHRYCDDREPTEYTKAAKAAVDAWKKANKTSFGTLTYRRGPRFLTIHDRRSGFEPADYDFDEIEARIYLAIDAGASAETVHKELRDSDPDAPDVDEIQAFLEELTDLRLVYSEENRFLGLAIGPVASAAFSEVRRDASPVAQHAAAPAVA